MRIKSELLWGESIQDKSRIYDLLHTEKLPLGYFLLICTERRKLEIIPAFMQCSRCYTTEDALIFGVANGKAEAYSMIADIINQIYAEHRYASVEEYAGEVLGKPI